MSKVWAFPFTFNVTLLILRSPYAQANDYERSEYGLDLQLFAEIEWITRINASSPETREPLPLRISNECRRRDSNPHASRRHPLKMVCLPIPPLRLTERLTWPAEQPAQALTEPEPSGPLE